MANMLSGRKRADRRLATIVRSSEVDQQVGLSWQHAGQIAFDVTEQMLGVILKPC